MTSPRTPLVYAMLALLLVLSGLDQTILSTALPSIVRELHGAALAPWVFSAYLMASTAVIPLYGKLADRWGVRPLLLLAAGLFALGSLACGLAPDMPSLVAARALQGLGGGGLMTLTMVATAALYPPAERARRMGGLGAAYSLATLLGPLAGGLLLEVAPWPVAFLINVPLALLAWAVLWRERFGQAAARRPAFDRAGALLLPAALVALLWSTRPDASHAMALAAGAVAAKLALAWWWAERRAADPVVPPALFRDRGFSAAAAFAALSGVVLFGAVVFLPSHFQRALHQDALQSSLHMLPLMAGILVASQAAGRALRSGVAPRRLGQASAAAMLAGSAALALLLDRAPEAAGWMSAALLPVGLGLGLGFPLVTVVAQRSAPAAHLGVATAVPVMLRALGGALGVAALGAGLAGPAELLAGAGARALGGVALAAALAGLLAAALPARLGGGAPGAAPAQA